MYNGMVFTSFVSFLVFLSAALAGFSIFSKRERHDKALVSYSVFLIITSIAWFFVGSQLFVLWLGKESLGRLFFIINQIFIFSSGVPLSYHLTLKIWEKEKFSRIAATSYSLGIFLGIFFLLRFGILESESTYFASKFQPNIMAFSVFAMLITPLVVFALVILFKKALSWVKEKKAVHLYDFFYTLVIVAYLLFGFFDERGLIVDWPLVFFRLIFTAVFFMAYLTFSFQNLDKEKFIVYED